MRANYYVSDVVEQQTNAGVWLIVSFVLAIVGGICFYFLYLKNDTKTDNKFLNWLKDFFNFKKMLIEDLLKVVYVISTIFITLFSFALIGSNFLGFLVMLILGNVVLRLSFEGILLAIMIWKNTTEINKKIKKQPVKRLFFCQLLEKLGKFDFKIGADVVN